MYQLKQVSHAYGEKQAINELSFSVERGSFVGVVGKSGSGKSTLLRLLNLMESPSRGRLSINGLDVGELSTKEKQRWKQKIGMAFQHFNLLNNLTVAENVALPLKLIGQKDQAYVTELLAFVGLQEKMTAYPSQLSGGEKQRVSIARALVRKPEILLCDEVTSALDEEYADEVLILLQKIHQAFGLTIFFVSHDLAAVKKVCHRVLVLEEGKLQGEVMNTPIKVEMDTVTYFEKVQRRLAP
ncbi:methionine ABC transporter ATP-binding protein [Enterococcus alcedinis]|uniref:ABC transporter ATP-binding protein n=1 Tax=Enterococcus alcedinis TaxID=1274384 RepID=A0A917JI93_9ENTE|nr:ATP-binding cassette domain-containing protein [Enterococcus alcedinis]MBP2102769.1 D-methionine transport system ATP-binding protein [Enterococcus alcedinis]GGI66330.1 ABC transporter ATP-binding protein [Enterococcus alcedinis]